MRLYNVYFFCFFAFFSIALGWQLLSGQRGLPLPRYVELGVGVVMVPVACLAVVGNWYLVGLTLWLLAHRRRELGWMRRLLFVALIFIPVWGVRRFQHLVRSGDKSP